MWTPLAPRVASQVLFVALPCLLAPASAQADGPHIAFHGTAGRYTGTLFTAPDPLVAGPADLSLLVQGSGDSALLSGPAVHATGRLTLAGKPPVAFTLVPGGAANRQLLGATVSLPVAGDYALTLELGRAGEPAVLFQGEVPVEENHGQRNTVLLAVFLPAAFIALFLVNQYAKQRLRVGRAQAAGR